MTVVGWCDFEPAEEFLSRNGVRSHCRLHLSCPISQANSSLCVGLGWVGWIGLDLGWIGEKKGRHSNSIPINQHPEISSILVGLVWVGCLLPCSGRLIMLSCSMFAARRGMRMMARVSRVGGRAAAATPRLPVGISSRL